MSLESTAKAPQSHHERLIDAIMKLTKEVDKLQNFEDTLSGKAEVREEPNISVHAEMHFLGQVISQAPDIINEQTKRITKILENMYIQLYGS